MSEDPTTSYHISVVIPRSRGRRPIVMSVARGWAWLATLLFVGLLSASVVAVVTYAQAMKRLREYSALAVEVETLRRQNEAVQALESELKDLRSLQQQMLHLAGIRPALGTDGGEAVDLPGADGPGPGGEPALFLWPVEGDIVRDYDESHPGVDIVASRKRPILAAGPGLVTEVGRDKLLGERIVISHGDSLVTVYAGNEINLVAPGDSVEAGQVIALVGQGPEGPPPHLHFEVRKGRTPMRPRDAIPDLFPEHEIQGSQ